MSINVLASTIVIASISYAQPVYETQYVEAVAQTSYTEVVTQTSYTEIQVSVTLAISDRIEVEVITPTDLISLGINKGFNDSLAGFTDTFLKVLNKQPAETLSTSEQITSRAIGKALADIQTVAESKQITLVKALLENVSPADLARLQGTKQIADIINQPVDLAAKVFYKTLSDSSSITDVFAALIAHSRSDGVSLADSSFISPNLPSTSDEAFPSDITALGQNKGLTDTLNLTDSITIQLKRNIVKSLAELVYTSEEQLFDISTEKADNMSIASSGLLIMQDYCDITYFLEDYVGTSRTFT